MYFIRYVVNHDTLYGSDLAILMEDGYFYYGAKSADGVALFTKELAECVVSAFTDMFVVSSEELSCHCIDTIQETFDLYDEYEKQRDSRRAEMLCRLGR